ncbi:MAG: FxsA protein [Myxococcaceae bacterium]|nr:FxsA protein [Myxococcaceae bacterium]
MGDYTSPVPLLFLAFTLLPFLELFLLIRMGRVIGPGNTIAFVIAMGVLGAMLAKAQGRKVVLEWQEALAAGRVPAEGVLGGVLVLVGGLLLIVPGVISDVAGLFCLLPPTRRAIAQALHSHLARKVAAGQVVQVQVNDLRVQPTRRTVDPRRPSSLRSDIIDTEGEEISNKPAND